MLKNKKGQFKDFTCLYVACQSKNIGGKVLEAIRQADIIAGLKNIKAKEQRDIIYNDPKWLQVVKLVEVIK
jgi:hypothetical protein